MAGPTYLTSTPTSLNYASLRPTDISSTWQTLDVSGSVPSTARTVILLVRLGASVARVQVQRLSPQVRFQVRSTAGGNPIGILSTDRWEATCQLFCPIDVAGQCQWQVVNDSNATCRLTVWVVGYE